MIFFDIGFYNLFFWVQTNEFFKFHFGKVLKVCNIPNKIIPLVIGSFSFLFIVIVQIISSLIIKKKWTIHF